MGKIKVLIVDDSALVRKLLAELLAEDPELEVVGTASDPLSAREKIKALNPDVLTLDVEMPKMDGLTFLANLMRLRPMPVVMVSSLAEANAAVTLEALELGAVDFVTKPKVDLAHSLADYGEEIVRKVKQAARTRVRAREPIKPMAVSEKHTADVVLAAAPSRLFRTTERLVAIGASTGGTEAIKEVLMRMPADGPIVVITQHIPPVFSRAFAERLNRTVPMAVQEAVDGQQLLPGHAYVAPGGQHLLVTRSGARYIGRISDAPPVNRHRPSVDVLFRSVAQEVGKNAVGVILTGMGDDGARGLREMRDSGAFTIAQDENSSVVWGMPGEAVKHGGVELVAPLFEIPAHIMDAAEKAA
jgi:two-component system chemotaxis response regulator CheB